MKRINNTTSTEDNKPTAADFELLGIEGVDEENIDKMLIFCRGNSESIAKLKKSVKIGRERITEEDNAKKKINEGTANKEDYNITGYHNCVTDDNIDLVNKYCKNNDKADVRKFVDSLNEALKRINNTTFSEENNAKAADFELLGIEGINEDNLRIVLMYCRGNSNNIAELIENAEAGKQRAVIENSAKKKILEGTAKTEDYYVAGYNCVTNDNIALVNAYCEKNKTTNISEYVDSLYNALYKINSWNYENIPTAADFALLGITGVTDENINEYLSECSRRCISISELKTEADKCEKRIAEKKAATENIFNGKGTLDDYNKLRYGSFVNSDNLNLVNNYCESNKTTNIYDYVISLNKAALKIQKGWNEVNEKDLPTVEDFKILGLTNVNDSNLYEFIAKCQGKCTTIQQIIEAANAETVIVKEPSEEEKQKYTDALDNIKKGTATAENYNAIGFGNEVKLYGVDILNQKCMNLDYMDMRKAISSLNTSVLKIKTGQADIEDFKALGINDIPEEKLYLVRDTAQNFTDVENLKDRVALILQSEKKHDNISKKIVSGNGTVGDYNALNLKVNSDDLAYVNKYMESYYKEALKNIQGNPTDDMIVITGFNEMRSTILKINTGKAEASDYNKLGINFINDKNIYDAAWKCKYRCQTLSDIYDALKELDPNAENKSSQEVDGKQKQAFGNINSGNSGIDDYRKINSSLKAADGVTKDGSKWYCLDDSENNKTGWVKNENKWYYYNADGSMAKNVTINGYKLGSDGALI